jgi:hypothetical protein
MSNLILSLEVNLEEIHSENLLKSVIKENILRSLTEGRSTLA